MRWWYRVLWTLFRLIGTVLLQVRAYGTENVPRRGGVVLASNHQSYLDPVLVGMCLDREMHFMARRSLFQNPVFRAAIVALNAFPIERDSRDVKGVKESITRLEAGNVLLVFPEGTRTRDGIVAPMKPGIRIIAERAAVPIVPVLIEGAYRVWPRNRFLPGIGRVNVLFGRPVRWKEPESFRFLLRESVRGLHERGFRRIQRRI